MLVTVIHDEPHLTLRAAVQRKTRLSCTPKQTAVKSTGNHKGAMKPMDKEWYLNLLGLLGVRTSEIRAQRINFANGRSQERETK